MDPKRHIAIDTREERPRRDIRAEDESYSVTDAAARLGLSVGRTRQLIKAGQLTSTTAGRRRRVSGRSLTDFQAARKRRADALVASASTEWDWEGSLVATLAAWLKEQGWQEVSRANAALREHGIDLVMEKHGRTRVIEVKGWPAAKHSTGPKSGTPKQWRSTMGRNYLGDLVLSAMVLRSSRPDDEVAIAVPDRETFVSLLGRIRSSLETLGIGAYVIDQHGGVKAFLSVEDVNHGRRARDQAVDRAVVRRLVEMSDADREAHFIASNRAALEMLSDARRGR